MFVHQTFVHVRRTLATPLKPLLNSVDHSSHLIFHFTFSADLVCFVYEPTNICLFVYYGLRYF